MYSPENAKGPFVPPNIIIPDDWSEARLILIDYFVRMADAVNARELGLYMDASLDVSGDNLSETTTSQTWFKDGTINEFRYPLRTVVAITGGLLDHSGGVATQSQAHGIQMQAETRFTRIFGVATDPGATGINSAMTLPHSDADNVAHNIELSVDATNVNLRYGDDYSNFTVAYIVLEWVD